MTDTKNLTTRRGVVSGIVGVGIGAPLLAACGSSGDSSSGSGSGSSGGTTSSGPIAKTSEIPEGGGKIFESEKVVITQPAAGEYKAFSSICTHQGCPVTKISGEDIDCTCHGSKFSIKDGSVVSGPASKGLEELTVTEASGELSVS